MHCSTNHFNLLINQLFVIQRPDLVSVLPVAVAHPHANVRALACRHVCRFFADDEGIAFLRQVSASAIHILTFVNLHAFASAI